MRHNLFPAGFPSTKQHGFSMLEILITMVIVATALFGTAGLQLNAMRMNQGGQFRTQAVFLASDIAERMEANKEAAYAGAYALPLTTSPTSPTANCLEVTCNAATLANWDISGWGTAIALLNLPGASWQITQISPANNNPVTYQIIINWTGRRTDTTYAAHVTDSSVGINLQDNAERFAYTATRTISRF